MSKGSKFKNAYLEAHKETFDNVSINQVTTEGSLIAVNANFIAMAWEGMGGPIAVIDTQKPTSVSDHIKLIRAHRDLTVDLKFSPFRSDLLATASEDCTVKLWTIPQEGLQEDLTQETQKYSEHKKKVSLINFNPNASDLIASAGVDNSVNVWNILTTENVNKLKTEDYPTSLEWNYNGSLLGITLRNKKALVYDPRANKLIVNNLSHESNKIQKMKWIGEHEFITSGFSKNNSREFKYWDIRKVNEDLTFAAPIETITIDRQSGIIHPFYDYESQILFLSGKGEGNIHYFEFKEGKFTKINTYSSSDPAKGITMYERRYLDYNKCEIDRFYKWSGRKLIILSFYVPRRNPGYDETLYPHVMCGEPALTFDEWKAGTNKDPILKEICTIENKFITKSENFLKKEAPRGTVDLNNRIIELEAKVKELEEKLKNETITNWNLKEEIKNQQKKLEEAEAKLK